MPPKTTTRPKKRKKRDTSPGNDRNHRTKARKIEAPQIDPLETQAQIKSVARIPRGLRGPKGIKLKQIQYHKFNQDILIYHYAASFLSVSNLRSLLNRHQHGYVNYLLGADPLASTPTPPGDETPPGCLEVGYLPSVFMLGGSALGFRLPCNPPATQWLCFDRDVRSLLQVLDINTSMQRMLFEHVASLSRAPPPEKKWVRKLAYTEHKDWYVSLRDARKVRFRLDLTWRGYWSDIFVENMKKKRDVQVGLQRRTAMVEGAVDMDEEEDYSVFGEEEKGSGKRSGRRGRGRR